MKLGRERERERDKLEAQRIKLEGINQYLAPLSLVSFSSFFLKNNKYIAGFVQEILAESSNKERKNYVK